MHIHYLCVDPFQDLQAYVALLLLFLGSQIDVKWDGRPTHDEGRTTAPPSSAYRTRKARFRAIQEEMDKSFAPLVVGMDGWQNPPTAKLLKGRFGRVLKAAATTAAISAKETL